MDARDFMRLLLDDEVWAAVQQTTPEVLRVRITGGPAFVSICAAVFEDLCGENYDCVREPGHSGDHHYLITSSQIDGIRAAVRVYRDRETLAESQLEQERLKRIPGDGEYGGCERVVENGHAPARCVKRPGHKGPHAFDCDIDGEVLYPRKSPAGRR